MRVKCTCGSSAIHEANGRLPVKTPRPLRPDGWLIDDHSRGWDLRYMPWTCSIGPEALVVISAAWIVADGPRSYLRGNPDIPFSTYLFSYSLFLLTHLSLCIGAGTRPGRSRHGMALLPVWPAPFPSGAWGRFAAFVRGAAATDRSSCSPALA